MSGGCEWPRRAHSDTDQAELRQDLWRGLLDLELPGSVRRREDYQDWRFSLRWICTATGVGAWRREGTRVDDAMAATRRNGGSPAERKAIEVQKRRLLDPKAWAQEFDRSH